MSETLSKNNLNSRAFSLVELAVVLSVIGILITAAVSSSTIIARTNFFTSRSLTENSPVSKISSLVAWYETTLNNSFEDGRVLDGYADQSVITPWIWYDISPESMRLRSQVTDQRLSRTSNSAVISYFRKSINNLPSFQFNGSGGFFFSSMRNSPISAATVFIVLQPANINASGSFVFDSGVGAFRNSVSITGSTININRGNSQNFTNGSSIFEIGKTAILAINLANQSSVYVNSVSTIVGGASQNAGSNPLSGIYLAYSPNSAANGFSGYISELIIFNELLKASDRLEVMNYLGKKYKIAIQGI